MSGHTPGPWKVFTSTDGHKVIGIGELTGDGIADCGFGVWRGGSEEATANAKLMAAAPEMADALLAIIKFEANPDFSLWAKRIDAARAALSKAGVAI